MNHSLCFEVGQLTHPGRARRTNEDAFGAYTPPDPRWRAAKGAIFAVADGMDGRRIGEIASRLAVQTVIQEYYRDPSPHPAQSLERAVRMANWRINEQSRRSPAYQGMGTTLVAAVVRGNELIVANVGDSRAYLARDGSLWQITRDHSWVAEEMAAGGLTPGEARRHPWRKVITRALGSHPDVKVDLFRLLIQPGDVVVLCSDGLSDEVWDREIWAVVSQSRPQEAARQLVRLANWRGGEDNVTAVVVRMVPTVWRPMAYPTYPRPAYQPAWRVQRPMAYPPQPGPSSLVPLIQLTGGLALAALFITVTMYLLA